MKCKTKQLQRLQNRKLKSYIWVLLVTFRRDRFLIFFKLSHSPQTQYIIKFESYHFQVLKPLPILHCRIHPKIGGQHYIMELQLSYLLSFFSIPHTLLLDYIGRLQRLCTVVTIFFILIIHVFILTRTRTYVTVITGIAWNTLTAVTI